MQKKKLYKNTRWFIVSFAVFCACRQQPDKPRIGNKSQSRNKRTENNPGGTSVRVTSERHKCNIKRFPDQWEAVGCKVVKDACIEIILRHVQSFMLLASHVQPNVTLTFVDPAQAAYVFNEAKYKGKFTVTKVNRKRDIFSCYVDSRDKLHGDMRGRLSFNFTPENLTELPQAGKVPTTARSIADRFFKTQQQLVLRIAELDNPLGQGHHLPAWEQKFQLFLDNGACAIRCLT